MGSGIKEFTSSVTLQLLIVRAYGDPSIRICGNLLELYERFELLRPQAKNCPMEYPQHRNITARIQRRKAEVEKCLLLGNANSP